MSITYNDTGVIIQSLSDILDERETKLKEKLGSDFVISGDSPIGNLQLADADRELAIQELILYLAAQMNPDTAEGIWLDYICALNNIYRKQPTYTKIPITVTGTSGTAIEAGGITIVDETTDRYYINTLAFTIGITGTIDVTFNCTDYGEVQASSSSTYSIKTPISGVTAIEFTSGGSTTVGTDIESDSHLRARREQELEGRASSTLASIKVVVKEVDNVEYVQCYENDTLSTVDGIPGKAFEVVVKGGNDTAIAQAILSKKPVGIQAYGSTITESVEDDEGNIFNIGITRPTDVPIAINIVALVDDAQPTSWSNSIKEDLVIKFKSTFDVGDEIYTYPLYSALSNYTNILNIETFQVKKVSGSTWSDSVTVGNREVGSLSIDNITITQNT